MFPIFMAFKLLCFFNSCVYKLTVFPVFILNFFLRSFLGLKVNLHKQFEEYINSYVLRIKDFLSIKGILMRILILCKKLLKYGILWILIISSSFIFCYILNWMLKPSTEISKNFEFSFDDIGKALKNEININCDNIYYERNCIFLEQKVYNVKLSLELMRNQAYQNDKYKNFEVQLSLMGFKKNEIFKKVVFIERFDYLIELIYDVFCFPFRFLGYMNHHNLLINFMDDFDNQKFNLEKIEIMIKDHLINVKKATFILIPYVGWISYFFGMLRIFILPLAFFVSVFFQIAAYIGIRVILAYFIFNDNQLEAIKENNELVENLLINTSLVHASSNLNSSNIITVTEINNTLVSDLSFISTPN